MLPTLHFSFDIDFYLWTLEKNATFIYPYNGIKQPTLPLLPIVYQSMLSTNLLFAYATQLTLASTA